MWRKSGTRHPPRALRAPLSTIVFCSAARRRNECFQEQARYTTLARRLSPAPHNNFRFGMASAPIRLSSSHAEIGGDAMAKSKTLSGMIVGVAFMFVAAIVFGMM